MKPDKVTICIRCTELPGLVLTTPPDHPPAMRQPVYLGIQRGQKVIEAVPADRAEVIFLPEFKLASQPDGSPNFLGPFAQGPPADRFVYLSWGIMQGGAFAMFRRLKIRLGHLTWDHLTAAHASSSPLTVTLRLTDRHGHPLCATPPATHLTWHLPG